MEVSGSNFAIVANRIRSKLSVMNCFGRKWAKTESKFRPLYSSAFLSDICSGSSKENIADDKRRDWSLEKSSDDDDDKSETALGRLHCRASCGLRSWSKAEKLELSARPFVSHLESHSWTPIDDDVGYICMRATCVRWPSTRPLLVAVAALTWVARSAKINEPKSMADKPGEEQK